MAWNEPGGGNRDPWGNKNDKGPPDLDEAFKKVQDKVTDLFGNKSSSGGGGSAAAASWGGGIVFVILLILWLLSGLFIVQPAERGVVTRFGAYVSSESAGLHWHFPWPIEREQRVNVDQNRSVRLRSQAMLTQDENIVEVDLAVQYNVKNAEQFLFRVRNPDETLAQVAESALRQVVGKNDMDFIITQGRDAVAGATQELMQATLDSYKTGLDVQTVNLQDAQPPEAVQAAFADAIKAREDEQRFINEAEAYSNGIIPQARGNAKQVLEEAKAYRTRVVKAAEGESNRFLRVLAEYEKAPQVTRDRLYIDSVEQVLTNTSKILMDAGDSNNLMYLPLDQLMGKKAKGGGASTGYSLDPMIPSSDSASVPSPMRESVRNRRTRENR